MEYTFKVDFFLADILDLLRSGGFTLDRDSACVANVMKLGEDCSKVNQTFSDKDLFAELAWVGGPSSVFRVHTSNMRPENIHSVYRIRFAVENEVSRIQSYGQIGQAYVANHAGHRRWGLLTGLHQEVLPIALAMLRHGANG